jgi:hypothetical protein
LLVPFCLSCSACPVLPVPFRLTCSACPDLTACSACSVLCAKGKVNFAFRNGCTQQLFCFVTEPF